jgi:hypothetical protein
VSTKKNWGYRISDFLYDHGNLIIGILGGGLLAYSGYLLESASPDEKLLNTISKECKTLFQNLNNKQYRTGFWVLMFGLGLEVLHTIIGRFQERSTSKIIKEKDEEKQALSLQLSNLENEKRILEDNISQASQDFYELFNYRLAKIATDKLGLSQDDRVSVYRHNAGERHFTMIGRYARNPYFNQAGRKIYSDNTGYIGMGWQKGKLVRRDLPRYTAGNEDKYYKRLSADANIPIELLKKIRMKSSCFYINTIKERQGLHAVAVIVIESLNPSGLDFARIDSIFDNIEEQIRHDLDALQRIEPKLSIAKNHGL